MIIGDRRLTFYAALALVLVVLSWTTPAPWHYLTMLAGVANLVLATRRYHRVNGQN